MLAPHYAISEALIVAVAIYCAIQLFRRKRLLGGFGVSLFGLAAGIGTVRISTGLIEQLAVLHKTASQLGGAIAIACVAVQIVALISEANRTKALLMGYIAIITTAVAVVAAPWLSVPIFLIWLAVAIVGTTLMPAANISIRLGHAALIAIFLFNILLVRQSPALGPDLSWHLFHVLVAIWLAAVYYILTVKRNASPA